MHFAILADAPGRLAAFYGTALGWETVARQGQTYWLVTTGPNDAPGINGGIMGRHFAQRVIDTVEVESLTGALARVTSARAATIHGPHAIPGVGMHAHCADPEGTMFGLLEPAKREG